MRPRLPLLALALLAAPLLAAPVPPPKPAKASGPWFDGWDKPVDPKGDCRFERKGDRLTLTVPGKGAHTLDEGPGNVVKATSTAPRLLRDVEGDFTIQVRVGGGMDGPARRGAGYAAGLIVMDGERVVQYFL